MRSPEDMALLKDRWLRGVAFLILGVLTFLLYTRIYDYVLALERDAAYSFFMFDRQFFLNFLSLPGGLLTYAGRFLAQFYEYTWLGALAVSALVVGFGFLLERVLSRRMGAGALFCALLVCVLLATAFSDVVLNTAAGLIVSTSAFLLYLHLPQGAARRLFTLLAIPALYLVCGGFFWLFAWWAIAAEWLDGRRAANLVWQFLFAALAVATPLAAWRWLFMVSLPGAFLEPTVFAQPGSAPIQALALYGALALLPFWTWAFSRALPAPAGWNRRFVAAAALLALLAVALGRTCYDANLREFAEYSRLYQQKRWDEILQKAQRTPSPVLAQKTPSPEPVRRTTWPKLAQETPLAEAMQGTSWPEPTPRTPWPELAAQVKPSPELMKQFFINSALYHKGRLLDEMFRYPQTFGPRGLILNSPEQRYFYLGLPTNDLDRAMFNSDLFFEMGSVNAALMYAYCQMTAKGETYENVKRIAECEMVRGNYARATKFLTMLKRTLFHRAEALRYEALLADAKARDACFAEQRSRLPTVELPLELPGFIPALGLLKSDPHNRMAFDYLMAWCLLDRPSLPMLAGNVGCLKAAGYDSIPPALQEGLLMLDATHAESLAPQGFRFDPDTVARFNAFTAQLRRSSGDRTLIQPFSGTFMYYANFSASLPNANYAYGNLLVANEFRALGWTREAITHYDIALRLDRRLVAAHAALAKLLRSQGRLEEAASHEREAQNLERISAPRRPPAGRPPGNPS